MMGLAGEYYRVWCGIDVAIMILMQVMFLNFNKKNGIIVDGCL